MADGFKVEVRQHADEEFVVVLVDDENNETWRLTPHPTRDGAESDAASIREFANAILVFGHMSWSDGASVR